MTDKYESLRAALDAGSAVNPADVHAVLAECNALKKALIRAGAREGALMGERDRLREALQGLLDALPSATTHPAIKAARAALAQEQGESK